MFGGEIWPKSRKQSKSWHQRSMQHFVNGSMNLTPTPWQKSIVMQFHFYGKAAERFFDAVESTIERIRNAPTQFREVEPGVRVRRVPNFPYAIYYIIESSEIIIVAVKHDRLASSNSIIFQKLEPLHVLVALA